ncbi:MAG: Fic family protein [Methylobacteriaceae bacterium]|nr:Fic family protein [Methylobacteriaceae bacterium]
MFHYHRMLPEYVWDASFLEGNPFTFIEVKTLLDGVTVGGHKLSDQEQVLNLAESSKLLLNMVKTRTFAMTKSVFTSLNAVTARHEALEWGVFRGEGKERTYTPEVLLGGGRRYTPLPTEAGAEKLNGVFHDGVAALAGLPPMERALAFFLFGALQQFFFDGNKRTSRFMMNGILMMNGINAISVPAARAEEFNGAMVEFYISRDATSMMEFLWSCREKE